MSLAPLLGSATLLTSGSGSTTSPACTADTAATSQAMQAANSARPVNVPSQNPVYAGCSTLHGLPECLGDIMLPMPNLSTAAQLHNARSIIHSLDGWQTQDEQS